jgi:F-box-like
MLPDDALLDIFDFRKEGTISDDILEPGWGWPTLSHVCRRWRNIILASPRRLDLRITCTHRTPTRKYLDIWPPFPISIAFSGGDHVDREGEDNIIAALEQRDRIFQISLFNLTSSVLKRFAALMEGPLPALRHITFHSFLHAAGLPDTFLGGSAPCLQSFRLRGIPFPALPNLVLSTSLNYLYLSRISNTGYISPPAIVTVLLALPNLNDLVIHFLPYRSPPHEMSPPSRTRAVLPALTTFRFGGVSQYLEDIVSQIDAPLLNRFHMSLFWDPNSDLDIRQLGEFIDRTESFKPFEQVSVLVSPDSIVSFFRSATGLPTALALGLDISAGDWQVSSMGRVCNQLSPLLSHVERLNISDRHGDELNWVDDNHAHRTPWLDLLIPFVSVKSLYVSEILGPRIARSLQELNGERVTEILPALQNLFLKGPQPSGTELEAFFAARQFSDHPIVMQCWEPSKRRSHH